MRLSIAVFALALTAACGGGSSETAGGTGDDFTSPKCASVWVAGKTIPKDYGGCYDPGEDTFVASAAYECTSGYDLYTFESSSGGFYVDADGKIVDAGEDYANDPGYSKRYDECNA